MGHGPLPGPGWIHLFLSREAFHLLEDYYEGDLHPRAVISTISVETPSLAENMSTLNQGETRLPLPSPLTAFLSPNSEVGRPGGKSFHVTEVEGPELSQPSPLQVSQCHLTNNGEGVYFLNFYCFIIHMCIQCLGHFSPLNPPYHPLCPLPLPPTPSLPGRNYFALISNFVEERV
jgi:hypothetical protein